MEEFCGFQVEKADQSISASSHRDEFHRLYAVNRLEANRRQLKRIFQIHIDTSNQNRGDI
jgi:hypothetical protein